MGPYRYKVISIEGEYATIQRTDDDKGDTLFIALALLPPGTDLGTELTLVKNLQKYIHNVRVRPCKLVSCLYGY